MAGQLSLTIGTATVSVPIKGSNALITAAVKRYAIQKGILVEGRTASEIGEDVLVSLLKYLRDTSTDRHRTEKIAEVGVAIEAEIALENDLLPPSPPPPN